MTCDNPTGARPATFPMPVVRAVVFRNRIAILSLHMITYRQFSIIVLRHLFVNLHMAMRTVAREMDLPTDDTTYMLCPWLRRV